MSSLAANSRELVADLVEALLRVVDEVHLVHAQHEVLHLQQRRDHRVPARLLEHALARVDEHQREVGGRRAGDHVARVLHVPGRVGDDELAPRRGEVAVRDVDGDALLALGAQAVGEQREVGVVEARGRGCVRSTDSSWSSKICLVSSSRRPMSVLLPSSTDPAVAKRSISLI